MRDELDIDELLARAGEAPRMATRELKEYLEDVRTAVQWMDETEPDRKSRRYEAWCDCHEDLEDLAEDLADLLESRTGEETEDE